MRENDEKQMPLFDSDSSSLKSDATKDEKEYSSRGSRFSKYIVYVDESGDHGMRSIDSEYPLFVLAFCVFHKNHYSEKVVPALERFKFKHFGHDQIVLHEHEIRKEKGAFTIFRTREEKKRFLDELTQIIDDNNFILISCIIDKKRLKTQAEVSENPYHIALGHCLDSLYDFLKEKGQHEKTTHVVVERRGAREDKDLELEFRRFCDRNNSQEEDLPFEILFGDKTVMSSGLQLADLVARPIGLSLLRPTQENRAFDVLKKKFYCKGGRKNVGKDYKEWGLKIYPPLKAKGPDETHRSQ